MIDQKKVNELKYSNKLLVEYIFSEFDKNEDECISNLQNEAEKGFDFFQIISDETLENHIHTLFCILEKLPCTTIVNVNTFHSFLLNFILENKNSYFIYGFLERFTKENSKKAKELLQLFEDDTIENIGEFLTILVKYNSSISINEKYDKSKVYINSELYQKRNAGYSILEYCILDNSFSNKDSAIDLLKEKYNTSDKESVLFSMCRLVENIPDFKDFIITAKNENSPKLDVIIARYMRLNYKKSSDKQFIKTLLFAFTNVNCEFIGNIDFLMIELIDSDFDTFFTFIIKWILESDFQNTNKKFDEIWAHSCSHLITNKNVQRLYSVLLLKDELVYHKVAANLISSIGIIHSMDVKFDEKSMEECNIDDIVFLCRKILGHIYDIGIQCQLFISIMKTKFENIQIRELIYRIFVNNLIPDYTFAIRNILQKKLETDDKKNHNMYSEFINICNQIILAKEKDIFPEMKISYEQKNSYSRKLIEDNKVLSKEVNSKSLATNYFKPVMTLYGKGFCYNVENSSKSIASDFHSFDTSFYMSSRDIYSPVDAEMERFFFRLAKRGDK